MTGTQWSIMAVLLIVGLTLNVLSLRFRSSQVLGVAAALSWLVLFVYGLLTVMSFAMPVFTWRGA